MGGVQDDFDILAPEAAVGLAPGPFAVSVVEHPRICYLCGQHPTTRTDSNGRLPICDSCTPFLRQPIALGR